MHRIPAEFSVLFGARHSPGSLFASLIDWLSYGLEIGKWVVHDFYNFVSQRAIRSGPDRVLFFEDKPWTIYKVRGTKLSSR